MRYCAQNVLGTNLCVLKLFDIFIVIVAVLCLIFYLGIWDEFCTKHTSRRWKKSHS